MNLCGTSRECFSTNKTPNFLNHRYYVAKARAEEEHGDLARSSDSDSDDSPDNHQKDESTEPGKLEWWVTLFFGI